MKKIPLILGLSLIPYNTYADSFTPQVEGSLYTETNKNYVQVNTLIPAPYNDKSLSFIDIRFTHLLPTFRKKPLDRDSNKMYEFNFGLGYRYLINNTDILGFVGFLDHRKTPVTGKKGFNQLTLNTHFLQPTWHYFANLYLPMGTRKYTKQKLKEFSGKAQAIGTDVNFIYDRQIVTERALTGADFRFSRTILGSDRIRFGGILYGFKDKKNVVGAGTTINLTLTDTISLNAQLTYDKKRKIVSKVGIRLNLPYDRARHSRYNKIQRLFTTQVQRDVEIVTASSKNSETIEQYQPHIKAINSSTLSNIDNANRFTLNLRDLSDLSQALESDSTTYVLAENDFNYNDAEKLEKSQILQKFNDFKKGSLNALQNGTSIKQINSAHQNLPHLERTIATLATQYSYQAYSSEANFLVADTKVDIGYARNISQLFRKYSRNSNSGPTTFAVRLPGYNNDAVIGRAGVILLNNSNGNKYVILGTDSNSSNTRQIPWNAWFSGRVESKDLNFQETIIREAFEESGGLISLNEHELNTAIKQGRFFYSPAQELLAIIVEDKMNIANKLNASLIGIQNDSSMPVSMKEMVNYNFVPLNEFIALTNRMIRNRPQNRYDPVYFVNTSDGRNIRVESHYARSLNTSLTIPALLK